MRLSFQGMIETLNQYWTSKGTMILPSLDLPVGAGTFHPATFLRALGPEPWSAAYVQPCRRPVDGRYGENPNRLQHYYQYQVVIKPAPANIQEDYLNSLRALGIDLLVHDVRFVEDNWESPTLGATGLGWEVWLDGMEVTQFTYFQQVAGEKCQPVTVELTYGLERLAMYIQQVTNVYDLIWSEANGQTIRYGDIFLDSEYQQSCYNFEHTDTDMLFKIFDSFRADCLVLCEKQWISPAYEKAMMASHFFNLLDARSAISTIERQDFLLKIRECTRACALGFLALREAKGFPLLKSD